jgi:hypothetical protein
MDKQKISEDKKYYGGILIASILPLLACSGFLVLTIVSSKYAIASVIGLVLVLIIQIGIAVPKLLKIKESQNV